MQIIQRQTDGSRHIWSPSSLESFLSCPYKFYLSGIEGYRREGDSNATTFGTLFHEAIELKDRLVHHGRWNRNTERALVKKFLKKHKEFPEARQYDIYAFTRALLFYLDKYEDEEYETVVLPDGRPALEVTFEIPIPGAPGKLLTGIIDRIVRNTRTERIYMLDHKTTKNGLDMRYFSYYKPNTQAFAYTWAGRKLFGEDVAGFLVDAVQTQVGDTRLIRYPVDIYEDQLEEWEKAITHHILQAEEYAQQDYWPQNYASCGSKGGCQFREIICSARPRHRQALLDSVDYVKNTN